MSGFYTDGLNQTIDKIEIVYPEKVSKDGSFVSYYLPQYYNVESLENRPKRSRDSIEHTDGDAIHFFVPIEGEKHQLELWPNLNFFSPELVVERRDVQDIENVNKAKMSQISQRQCHYSGRIVGKPASRAAVSTCYGLTGYIQLPFGEEYLIEPVKDFKPAYNKEHPHIMYKRSGIKDHHGTSNCLTKGSAKDALGERLKWESMFGSQLKRDFSALNMNDVMREETTKPPVANIQPNMVLKKENLKSFGNFKRVYQQNEIIAEENMHLKNNSQNHEFPQQNSDKVKNEYGNKLKSKPLREELGRIQIPDVNILPQKLSSSQTISGQHLLTKTDAESYENAKGPYKNYLKPRRVKRELTDQDQDIAQTRDSSKTRLNQMSNDEQIHNNCTEFQSYDIKQENSLKPIRNTEDEKARFLSQSEQKIEMSNTCSEHKVPSSDVHLKKTCNNGMNDREMNDFNNIKVKVDSLKSNDVENCNSPVNGNKVNTDLTNNQKYPHPNIEKNAKRDIHLDTSEKSWKSYEKGEASYAAETPTHNTDKKTRLDGEVTNKKSSQLYKKTKQNNENMYNNNRKVNTLDPVKDMDKTKVKKDIGGGLLYVPQQEKNYNTQFVANKPLDKDKHSNYNKHDETLSDIENENVYKIVVEDGNLKDDLGSTKENKQNVDLIDEPFQPAENSTNTHADEIVIRIKTPEGTISEVKPNQDINSGRLKYSVINPTTNNEHIDSVLDQNIGMFLTKNNLKRNNVEKNKRGTTEIFETDSQGGSYVQDTRNADKGISSQDFNIVVEDAENGNIVGNYASNKAKRDDNTIHLVIETEPEVKSQEVHDSEHPASNLFCQGRNCLEIKPIFLNDTKSSLTSSNSTSDNPKEKVIKKRDSEEDGFCGSSTTEAPLRCNDFNHKIFTIELMITVDYKVVHMHEDDDIENFILTIINMVSSNFNDKSLGLNLNVVLVRLILLTTCIKELDSDRFNPEELLENFCTWQVLVNPGRDDHPHHHDLAIFVSKMDKCQGQTMGVSYMTSVCRPDKACIVCVDEGLLLANTITHLIGHSLGADHDDGQSSGCGESLPDGTTYHMAPTITETSSAWSVCSRDAITQFVQTQGSWCLIDFPVVRTYNFPLMLPGQIYSAAQQCKLNFHMSAVPCSVGAFCNKLYCQITDKLCATKGDPPADGTFCASDMWCFHKQCVHVGRRPGAINGEWGPWTEWSLCTRSCGGGVSSSYRICNNPKPQNGGRYCIGERIRHKICETKPCQGFTESFRDLQCKRTEDRPFRGKLHNWVQYESLFINIECALVCQNRKGDVVMRSPIVADGTPCKAGTKNVCIQGMCRNVGCDYMIDSTAREDACGVCHGNGTECRIVGGVFDEAISKKGLIEFLRIPKDSGMIFVREIAPSSNTLVVSGSINRVFYLNGLGSDDSMAGDVAFGLSHGVYEKRGGMERIFIRGPTTEDLIFYIFFRDINKGVHYQYAILEYDPTYIPRYLWQYLDWDACSDPCSGGSQRARAKCVEDRGGVVDDKYCTESSRPLDIVRPCNDFPCQAKWWVSVWSDCICTGATSVMFRSVLCMRANDESGTRVEVVKESECTLAEKPPTQKPCNYSEEDTECAKRSVVDDSFYQSRRELRRSVNPRLAFSAVSPVDSEQLNQDKDNDRKNVSADICVTTEVPSVCPTEEITSETPSTCKETSAPQPHKKTTCCRTTPHRQFVVKTTFETTTIRPVAVKLDQLNINNFGLTVVPLEYSGKKKLLPLSDPEFINLGNVGQFGIADELNATVISGQEALDLLEFARSNASEEPIVLHEDMHN